MRSNDTTRHVTLRRATLVLGLALGSATPLSGVIPHGVENAHAADERRVIDVRKFQATAEQQSREYALEAQRLRMEGIERLKGLLARDGLPADTKAEMMLRLADLYFQEGRYLYLEEMAEFDKKYDECFNDETCAQTRLDSMKPDNSGSRRWQEQSIALYENILKNHPRYARADQATFFLGSALQDLGRKDEASEAFKKLVKVYADSDYVPDAYVMIGEYYFEEGNAHGALRAYLKASSYKDSEKYPFAMYKLAWCYYNVGEYQQSIDTMKQVVSYSMSLPPEKQNQGLQLQEEALKDLVRFFADAGEMNQAYEYFTKLGKKDLIRSMLQRLAGMYFEQGKFDQAVTTYRRLINEDPNSEDNPQFQAEIISCYKKIGQRERTLEEIDRLRRDYGKESAWARANASNPNAIQDSMRKIEENLRRVAVDFHNEAREYEKSRHPGMQATYDLARQAYATYLEEFGASGNEHIYNVRYAYGELLYKLKDFKGAFDQYMQVVQLDPKGKHSRFCAESAIFAAEEQVKLEGGAAASGKVEVSAKQAKEAQPLTEWEQRLVDACAQFARLYPDDKKTINAIYKSGYLLYNKFRFEEAAEQFKLVIQMDPKSQNAEQAANLILDSFVVRENWQALKDNAKFYYDQPGLGSAKFKKDVFEIYQNASFKVIEVDLAKDKDESKAGDRFVAFYEEFPDAPTAAQALNNASIYYYNVGRVEDAVKVRHILVEDEKFGPKTRYYYDQIAALGYDYETIADFEKASFYYEKLWALYPDERKKAEKESPDKVAGLDGKAGDAIYSAAVFRNGLGQWEKAIENYNQFVTAFPKDERVPEVRLTVANIYEDREMWQEAANVFQAYYTKPPEGAPLEYVYFARLHHGQALEKLGEQKKAMALYEETVKMYEKYVAGGGAPGPHTEFVAEMMFELAQPQLENYLSLRIKGLGPGASRKAEDKALMDSLSKKAKALAETEATFTKVVSTGAGEWGLAALVALGRAYEDMAHTLRTGDTPSYLTPEQRELYMMQIEDRAYIQEEKAVNAYKLALDKSYELTLYNDNTAFATRKLGELRPNDYPGLRENLLDPRYTSTKARRYDFESSL